MNRRNMVLALLSVAWISGMTIAASAQVERVIVEADGLKDACVPGLQAALDTLPSVSKYAVSVEKQMFTVLYSGDQKFDTRRLYWAADKGEAGVKAIHLFVRGTVHETTGVAADASRPARAAQIIQIATLVTIAPAMARK